MDNNKKKTIRLKESELLDILEETNKRLNQEGTKGGKKKVQESKEEKQKREKREKLERFVENKVRETLSNILGEGKK